MKSLHPSPILLYMSFKDQFKALLEELVLPEIQSIKTELSETKMDFNAMSEKIQKLDESLTEGFTRLGEKLNEAVRNVSKTSNSGQD